MSWLFDRVVENLDLIIGAADILGGLRRVWTSLLVMSLLVFCSGCTFTRRESQDAIGTSTSVYALSWGGSMPEPAAKPRRKEVKRPAVKPEPEQMVATPEWEAPAWAK